MPKLSDNTQSLRLAIQALQNKTAGGEGGTDTSDATAIAEDLTTGKTAYGALGKLVGTNPYEKSTTDQVVSTQADLIAQVTTILQNKAGIGNTETWILTLEDGTEIQKEVIVK